MTQKAGPDGQAEPDSGGATAAPGLIPHHDADLTWFHDPILWSAGSSLASGSVGLGSAWSAIILLSREGETFFNGRLPSGLYAARFSRHTPQLAQRVADFLRYERAWGRRVVVASEVALDIPAFVSQALDATPPPNALRLGDPAILVHSTTSDRWRRIRAEGQLLSASWLRRRGVVIAPLGFESFGEPPEYAQFVHFSPLGVPNGEAVVLSHQCGALNTDLDAAYAPGARLYLRAHKMVLDGICVRDGLHVLKVHGELPLEPYLVDAITPDDLDDKGEAWTPRRFAAAADQLFLWRHLREPGA